MSPRNNEDRVGATEQQSDTPIEAIANQQNEPPPPTAFSFATPTEFVELPSQGRFYPENHPLHNCSALEIKYMTAKDEDILTSRTLLKKGIAIERLLQNVIVNKAINVDDMLLGDKNSVIITTRVTGYGADYNTKVLCPVCGTSNDHSFNLGQGVVNFGGVDAAEPGTVTETSSGIFAITMPQSKAVVSVRLMVGRDEKNIAMMAEQKKKHNLGDSNLTDQLRMIIVDVNGSSDRSVVHNFVENMPAIDSRYLRGVYAKITPNVDLTQHFSCDTCDYSGDMEVPFTPEFFWPKQ